MRTGQFLFFECFLRPYSHHKQNNSASYVVQVAVRGITGNRALSFQAFFCFDP